MPISPGSFRLVALADKIKSSHSSKRKYHLIVLFIAYTTFLITASLLPADGTLSFPHADKLFHFLGYLGFVIGGQITFRKNRGNWRLFITAVLLGLLLEWGQSFVPTRQMSLLDAITNTIGAFVGHHLFQLYGFRIIAWLKESITTFTKVSRRN